ncbi:hypothetical protein ACFW04_000078 [Cataglyphis niger]
MNYELYYRNNRQECNKITQTMIRILKLRKRGKISCDICKITFDRRRLEYKKHMLKHSNNYNFQCDVCAKKFKYKNNMNRHKVKVHSEASLYTCQYCDFSTIHYPCICDVCSVATTNRMSLYFHKNYKHKMKDVNFQYPMYKKKLQTQKNLNNHVKQHVRTYMCEECGMELMRKAALKKHIKTHSGEKPYLCHICKKSFASATSRKVYLLTHSRIRPYICTICGRSFTQRPALSVHWKKKHSDVTEIPLSVSIRNIIETMSCSSTKTKDV